MRRHSALMISESETTCAICEEGGPEWCCTECDPTGVPYHANCWKEERPHRPTASKHRKNPIRLIEHLRRINEPNQQAEIEPQLFEADYHNCFIEYNSTSNTLKFGPRAFPLLRHEGEKSSSRYPSFVSFVGRTASGKSFLLRTLLASGSSHKISAPIPAPGAKAYNHQSTSGDIHLYADYETAESHAPILFLDCEGLEGASVPAAKLANEESEIPDHERRRHCVEYAYPRIVYAFSTCIVFVTSGGLPEASDIARKLIRYAVKGASGFRNQPVKPSLFVVFNKFTSGSVKDFDWSIEASTRNFLSHEQLKDLELYYESVWVIYIPSFLEQKCDIAVRQLEVFRNCLRQEHEKAFRTRQEFRLVFTPEKLMPFVRKALYLFSDSSDAVFDWSIEASRVWFGSSELTGALYDLWTKCNIYYGKQTTSPRDVFNRTRDAFEKHVEFCFRLSLSRNPPHGLQLGVIPPSLEVPVDLIDQLLSEYAICNATSTSGIECRETKYRHSDHHQGIDNACVYRWWGEYEASGASPYTFRDSFTKALSQKDDIGSFSLFKATGTTLHQDIRSLESCFGCLQGPPSTILACGHALCSNCIRDLADNVELLHRIEYVRCPFHNSKERLSPRLLPAQSGYRILSLDGGGVKGLALLTILKEIETRCFDIPTIHLYDLIVGTSIGGQITLALTCLAPSVPLTVSEAVKRFRELVKGGFVRSRFPVHALTRIFLDKTKYKTRALEKELKAFFGAETKLYGEVASPVPSPPNVAVTTVLQETFEGHLVTNYNRKAKINDAYPLLFGLDPDQCMPVWAAARCTSAAFPYFESFQWQGQRLLDGGFELNCPAAAASSEAKHIWSEKQRDILVSLGTGRSNVERSRPVNKHARLLNDIIHAFTSAGRAFDKFKEMDPDRGNLFRLEPVYNGPAIQLDDVKKLDQIEKLTESWIKTSGAEICTVCNQLIASLFFFCPSTLTKRKGKVGEIVCRLPVNLKARQNLFDAMKEKQNIFRVEYIGKEWPPENINSAGNLESLSAHDEMHVPVELRGFSEDDVEIRISMLGLCSPFGANAPQWYSISGPSWVLREDGTGRELFMQKRPE